MLHLTYLNYKETIMELKTRIENLKSKILKNIEEAAKRGNTEKILSNSKIVEEAERLIKRWEEINSAVNALEKGANSTDEHTIDFERVPASKDIHEFSHKQKGKIRRNEIIRELKTMGVSLFPVGGTTYKTKNGNLIGIASASERLPNRWFLGLPLKSYSSVVLICENKSGELLNFILPKDFLNSNIDKMSHDEYGQIKFNIVLKGESYQLRIPDEGFANIDNFRDNYIPLRV